MRTAFMRDQYPETIFAGFASSAPTEAKVDMSVYFEPIARGMERYGAGNCSKDIHAAIGYIDKELGKGGKTAANLKLQFLGGGADKNSDATFADALSTIFWLWQSYGMDGSPWSLGEFCNYLETDPVSTKVASKDGWAKSKGAKFVVDRWASWPKFAGVVSDSLDTVCSGDKNVTAECNLDVLFTDPASVSWTWQYCTQWGKSSLLSFPPSAVGNTPQRERKAYTYSTHTNPQPRLLPIRQPRPQPTRLKIQLPPAPTRHLPPPIPHGQSPALPGLAANRPHQRRLRRLGHPPLAALLVRRRIRPLAHALPAFRGALGPAPARLHQRAKMRRGPGRKRDLWICPEERAALL
jgi:hypothetical protein